MNLFLVLVVACSLDGFPDAYLEYQLDKAGIGSVKPGGRLGLKLSDRLTGRDSVVHADTPTLKLPATHGFACEVMRAGETFTLSCKGGGQAPETIPLKCTPGSKDPVTQGTAVWDGVDRHGMSVVGITMVCY